MKIMVKKTRGGFTLIELLVVIFIITLLSSTLLLHYRSGEKRYALEQAAQILASNLRKAQNMSLGGVDVALYKYYGFGIEADPSVASYSYYLYADKDGDYKYSNTTNDVILETVNLTGGVKITSSTPSPFDVFFKSPYGNVYISGNPAEAGSSASITLEIPGSGLPAKVVKVNSAGLIQVQ